MRNPGRLPQRCSALTPRSGAESASSQPVSTTMPAPTCPQPELADLMQASQMLTSWMQAKGAQPDPSPLGDALFDTNAKAREAKHEAQHVPASAPASFIPTAHGREGRDEEWQRNMG